MQRKLMATLVASALEIYASAAGAQAVCEAPNTTAVVGASPVRSSGLNPLNGFPEYVTDANNLSIKRCTDPLVCFFDPVIESDPFSLQIGSGGEAFYWSADAVVSDTAGTPLLKVTMAAETAFLQNGPNGEPINGSQFAFLRLRLVLDAPVAGRYTVKHPYGTQVFDVDAANVGPRAVFFTIDTGLTPNQSTQGAVGPFLTWPNYLNTAPRGFVGDVNVLNSVVGSPCGVAWNRVEMSVMTGPQLNVPFDFGGGQTVLITDQFTVQGAIQDTARVQTYLNADRVSYSRAAQGNGQIDAYATSTPTAVVTLADGPATAGGNGLITNPVTLSRSVFVDPGVSVQAASVAQADAALLPAVVALTATSRTTVDTTLNVALVDFVDIAVADWSQKTGKLTVTATSGDALVAPTLTLRGVGDFAPGSPTLEIATVAPPAVVHVDSSAGGTAEARVRVIGANEPGTLSAASIGSTRLTLNWTDNTSAETAFNVYRVAANGTRTLIGTTAANVTSFLVGTGTAPNTVLSASTAYTFQVDAVVAGVGLKSNLLDVTTLALPVAPSNVVSAMDTQKAIRITWSDNATDETGYIVSRATVTVAANGTQTVGAFSTTFATAPAGSTSFVDTTAAVNTVYQYRVVTARDLDRSLTTAAGATSASLRTASTLTATQAPLAPTAAIVNPRQINLSWAGRVPAPTATVTFGTSTYQVYRRLAARAAANGAPAQVVGTFTPISGLLPSTTTTYSDTSAVPGVSYQYGIGVSNWANTFVPTAASTAVSGTATLSAVTNLVASPVTAAQPNLSWVDTTVDESLYRVQRRALALNTTSNAITGTLATVATLAANTTTFSDGSTLVANTIYEYEVAPLSGTTVGPLTTVRAVTGPLPGVATTTALTAAGTTLTLTWPASTAPSVGGYDVQRCIVVTGTETCTGTTGWLGVGSVVGRRVGTVSFAHTAQAVNNPTKTYVYRVITKTGGVVTPELFGAPSAGRSIVR